MGRLRGAHRRAGQPLYTASGSREGLPFDQALGDPNWLFGDTRQRLAHASARIRADANGVWFAGESFRNNEIIAEADGKITRPRTVPGRPIIYAFRDPFVFQDPEDGQVYMAFEGNTAGRAGTHRCTSKEIGPVPPGHHVPGDANLYTGNIGLARARGANLRRWTLLPPLLSADCVNQQLERPHFVIRDGRYHLFTISHTGTDAPACLARRRLRVRRTVAAQRLSATERQRPGARQPARGAVPAVLGVRDAEPARRGVHRQRPHPGGILTVARFADDPPGRRGLQHVHGGEAGLRVHPGNAQRRGVARLSSAGKALTTDDDPGTLSGSRRQRRRSFPAFARNST